MILFIYDNYDLSGNQELNDYMLQYSESDTLRVVAKFMLASSGGELLSFNVVENTTTSKLMDIAIRHADASRTHVIFSRVVMKNKKMLIFNLSAQECNLSKLLAVKDPYFNSLLWY